MIPMTPTEDIRAARHRLAKKFDNDLGRIVADLRRQQQASGGSFVTLPPRRPAQVRTTNKAVNPSGGADEI